MRVYFDRDDWWVGYYRGSREHFVCLFPTLVICWSRKRRAGSKNRETVKLGDHRPAPDWANSPAALDVTRMTQERADAVREEVERRTGR